MRRLGRLVAFGLAAVVAAIAVLAIATARPGNPALWPPRAGAPTTEIFVVSHGYHAGIVLPTARAGEFAGRRGDTALVAVTQRFASYPFIEIGWGDQGFYASVPDLASLNLALALRALLRPGNVSVLHVVGLSDTPRKLFASADIVRVELSEEGFAAVLGRINASFAAGGQPPQVLGQGIYGPSLFYRANGAFHIFNVCNHWVADLLSAAGLPVTPVLATLPQGLLLDLKWRAGLDRLPAVNGTQS